MECRSGCAACCIAISISSPIPGLPNGKPAGVPCIHLDEELRCKIFGHLDRPETCQKFKAEPEAAKALINSGELPVNDAIPEPIQAALTTTILSLLNTDEALTKE